MVLPRTYMPQTQQSATAQAVTAAPKKKALIYMQKWTTVGGSTTGVVITQDSDLWVDMTGIVEMKLTAEIIYASNATLTLETANSMDGPWFDVNAAGLGAGTNVLTVSSEGPNEDYKAMKYLRWRADGSNSNWEICFNLRYEVLTT